MARKTYRKLVRDNIPSIIRASGKTPKVRILDSDESLLKAALAKVVDEAKELQKARTKCDMENELADLREVISLVDLRGSWVQDSTGYSRGDTGAFVLEDVSALPIHA